MNDTVGIQQQMQWAAVGKRHAGAAFMGTLLFISRVWGVRPVYAALVALVIGAGLIPLSLLAGVAVVTDATGDMARQVGFVNAFNWSIVYGVIVPLFVLALFGFLTEIRRLIKRLGRLGMIVDGKGKPMMGTALREAWDHMMLRSSAATILFIAIAFPLIMRDWYYTNFVPLYVYGNLETLRAAMPNLPLDWSTAAIFAEQVAPLPNVLFSFVAYMVQALSIVVLVHLVVFSIALGAFLEIHSRADAPVRIVPNPRLLDDRMGLAAFRRVINYLLLMFTTVFGVMYAVRLWQQFLRSGLASSPEYIRAEISGELWPETLNHLPAAMANLLHPGMPASYAQTATLAMALFTAAVSISFVLVMIQVVVHRGRRFLVRRLVDESSHLHGAGPDTVSESMRRIDNLPDWPLVRPTRNQVLSFMLFMIIVLVMYRLAFVLLLVLLVMLLRQTIVFIDGYANEKN